MVEIIYIATDEYSNFFDGFASTIKYFLPGVPKIVKVLSNVDRDYTIHCDDVVRVDFIKIFDLFYPCINLNKTNFISQLLPYVSEYVFYFDADTIFLPVEGCVWWDLKTYLDMDFFCIGKHPFYQLKDDVEWKSGCIENFYEYFTTRDKTQESYIEDREYTYLISSFFCAKRNVMEKMCNYINNMIRTDMCRENDYKIPYYSDENYFNKVVYDVFKGTNDDFKIKIGNYILYNEYDSVATKNESFMLQKGFNSGFKRLKR